ncbi:hypothetical protein [Methylobacterium oryzihabitans]|uniref:Uncharacterized protein n=1 Tax=Methylobacterium oryzihabitans TaxID=2499852 RepID=A0A437PBT7_9HYPH|nr:hypothetical protein [Methylobacterium oryzihabitans]RVU19695.1 hypothetical protein EOE48_07005 [Methylobacterium oryzihabitans]
MLFDTTAIVDNIRCEARSGLQEAIIEILHESFSDQFVWGSYNGTTLANALTTNPKLWNDIRFENLHPKIRSSFALYRNTQIAYLFQLMMDEQNNESAGVGFTQRFVGASNRIGRLGLSGSSARTRTITRTFNTVDTFEELVVKVSHQYCDRERTYDIIYPVRGKLPVKDLMKTYIRLNHFRNLAGPGVDLKGIFGTDASPAIPQMGDNISFSTKLSAGLSSGLTAAPPGLGLLLTSVGLEAGGSRSDSHRVIVVISTSPDAAKLKPLDARQAPPLEGEVGGPLASSAIVRKLTPIKNGNLTEARANYARNTIDQQLRTNFLNDIATIAEGFQRSQ